MNYAVIDFESNLIAPAQQAPEPVCLGIHAPMSGFASARSHLEHDGVQLFHCYLDEASAVTALTTVLGRGATMVGANIAIDLAMALSRWPFLSDLIWAAYDNYRVWDVLHTQKLINLGYGRLQFMHGGEGGKAIKQEYSLEGVVRSLFGHQMTDDEFRLLYGTFRDVPFSQWPAKAISYVCGDVRWTERTYLKQLQADPALLVDVARQARAAWWLTLMSARGFRLSPQNVERLDASIHTEMQALLYGEPGMFGQPGREGLVPTGLVDENGKRNTDAAGRRLALAFERQNLKVPRTDEGKVELTKEACKDAKDPLLDDYSRYTELVVTLGKLEALKDAVRAGMPIQSRFEVLLESGRTSCSGGRAKKKSDRGPNRKSFGFQIQNVKKEPGLRECFVARSGFVLGSLDYGQLESCCWAQVCLDLFGFSNMASMLNADVDVHSKLGAMMFELQYEWVLANKKSDPKAKKARAGAKPFVFGKPGGMGARGMMAFANAPPYNLTLTEEECQRYGRVWAELFPENKPYFAYVDRCVKNGRAIKQVRSNRIRGGIGFTDGANCVDYETEALTKRGWVKGLDLTLQDEILTKNAATNKLEWQKPTNICLYPNYNGPLVEFRTNRFSAVTTPAHRWLVTDKKTGKNRCVTSETISRNGDHRIHRAGELDAPDGDYTDDFLRLVGWVLTDGSFVKDASTVRIYQTKLHTTAMIDDLLLRSGIHAKRRVVSDRGAVVWAFSNAPLHRTGLRVTATRAAAGPRSSGAKGYTIDDYVAHGAGRDADSVVAARMGVSLRMIGIARKKLGKPRPAPASDGTAMRLRTMFPARLLTPEFVGTLSQRQARIVYETMILGDGHVGSAGQTLFYTRSKLAAEAFQMLCALAGFASNVVWTDLSEREIKKYDSMKNVPKSKSIWTVHVYRRDTAQVQHRQVREFSEARGVWCPQVPNTYFVARRAGTVYVTGNTMFQGLAADVAKAALYECSRVCYTGRDSRGVRYPALYGSYLVNFIHDEGIFEFPAERAHEAAYEATEIMTRVAADWMPGCPPKVEPALMLEWAKDAAPVFDKVTKKLIPWTAEAT